MIRKRSLWKSLAVSSPLSLSLLLAPGYASEGVKPSSDTGGTVHVDRSISPIVDPEVKPAQAEGEVVQPNQPLSLERELTTSFGRPNLDQIGSERVEAISAAPNADVIAGSEATIRATSDAGSLLGKSLSSTGVELQRRNPVSYEPRIRGHKVGQVYTNVDGAMWFPARQDLDTMLSKIDAGIIRDIIVLKGPYSVRYGPGFSFIDIQTVGTPRTDCGYEWHGRSSLNYQTNGEQWYGRESAWGGSTDWGYRIGYGHRTGNDYDSGDDIEIPTSYNVRDVDAAFGYDLSENSHLEFSYLRLDQTDTEYPGQIFDVDFLVTDGFTVRYNLDNQANFDALTLETWYNRTRLEGDAQGSAKREQVPILDRLGFVGDTDIDQMSTGFRLSSTWGEAECPQLTAGVDLRYMESELNELDIITTGGPRLNFPIPRSHQANPGVFVDYSLPVGERLRIKAGSRFDWLSANAEGTDTTGARPIDFRVGFGSGLSQNFDLVSGFLSGEYDVNENWTLLAGVGHAERAPTLTELYAAAPFLAILQQGSVFVIGDPQLDKERLWQLDLGLKAEYCKFRGGINGFYSWINDYITYVSPDAAQGVAFRQFDFVNTELATLSGGEMYGEYQWNDWITPFGSISYVEGRDHSAADRFSRVSGVENAIRTEEEPLPGIYPLSSRVGVRVSDAGEDPRWSIEFSARVVENQDRVASSLRESESAGFTTYDLRSFWRATDTLVLVAGVENFSDKNYREHLDLRTGLDVLQPGINFYFGAEWKF